MKNISPTNHIPAKKLGNLPTQFVSQSFILRFFLTFHTHTHTLSLSLSLSLCRSPNSFPHRTSKTRLTMYCNVSHHPLPPLQKPPHTQNDDPFLTPRPLSMKIKTSQQQHSNFLLISASHHTTHTSTPCQGSRLICRLKGLPKRGLTRSLPVNKCRRN